MSLDNKRMNSKNQIAIISGIVAILAISIIVGSYNIQPAKAAYGNDIIKPNAQCGKSDNCDGGNKNWGGAVSDAARDDSGHGISDWRKNGCKLPDRGSDC
jgi:hypothetical protein